MKGCASVCVVSGGILWDKDHRRRCSEEEGEEEGQQRWPQGWEGRVEEGREEDDKFALGHH